MQCDDSSSWLIAHATLALPAHDAQPRRFCARGNVIEAFHDLSHDVTSFDHEHGATWLAFGAAAENLELAASASGLAVALETFVEPGLVWRATVTPAAVHEDPLFACIAARETNREHRPRVPLSADDRHALEAATESRGARLHLRASDRELAEIADLIGACDQLLAQWPIPNMAARSGGARGIEESSPRAVAASSAVGLVTYDCTSRASYFRGGRAVQRMRLAATARGLAIQPLTRLPDMIARLERGGGADLSPAHLDQLRVLADRYRELFPTAGADIMLFRIARA